MSQTEPPEDARDGVEPPNAGPSSMAPAPGIPDATTGPPDTVAGWAPAGGTSGVEGWQGPQTTPASRGTRLVGRLLVVVVLGLIVVGIVGGVVFRDRISSSTSDLAVGDCFDAPSMALASGSPGGEIEDVQHHPCSEPHVYETFAVFRHPAVNGDPYPGSETLFSYAETNCLPPFATYVGVDFQESVLSVGYIVPQEAGWLSGERTISCFLGSSDDSPVTGSLKGANR
jgi:hypothetical protein